jgi:hypothetical protein
MLSGGGGTRSRRIWLWAASTAAVLLLLVAIGFGCLVFLALAAFAAEIFVWPLIGALLLGLPAAIVGPVSFVRTKDFSAEIDESRRFRKPL